MRALTLIILITFNYALAQKYEKLPSRDLKTFNEMRNQANIICKILSKSILVPPFLSFDTNKKKAWIFNNTVTFKASITSWNQDYRNFFLDTTIEGEFESRLKFNLILHRGVGTVYFEEFNSKITENIKCKQISYKDISTL